MVKNNKNNTKSPYLKASLGAFAVKDMITKQYIGDSYINFVKTDTKRILSMIVQLKGRVGKGKYIITEEFNILLSMEAIKKFIRYIEKNHGDIMSHRNNQHRWKLRKYENSKPNPETELLDSPE